MFLWTNQEKNAIENEIGTRVLGWSDLHGPVFTPPCTCKFGKRVKNLAIFCPGSPDPPKSRLKPKIAIQQSDIEKIQGNVISNVLRVAETDSGLSFSLSVSLMPFLSRTDCSTNGCMQTNRKIWKIPQTTPMQFFY